MATLSITNFGGRLTRIPNGDINSGMANFTTSWGYDPFSKPGSLTWFETETNIDSGAAVITDLIICAKQRVESFTTYVYALGHTGRLYKIQTNTAAGSTSLPNVDTPVLLQTLSVGSPDFTYGASMEFFGATQKIYISAGNRINTINFDGSGEATLPTTGLTGVFLPLKQFIGKLYFGNGQNIGEIDSTGTITSTAKLSPALPINTYVKDLDVTPDGRYMAITSNTVSTLEQPVGPNADGQNAANADSYIFRWNGTDVGVTSFSTLNSTQLTSMQILQNNEFTFGGDSFGMSVSGNDQKQLTLPNNKPSYVNSTLSSGNFISWMTPEALGSLVMRGSLYYYGSMDNEVGTGLWRLLVHTSTQGGFINSTPVNLIVNNKFTQVKQNGLGIMISGYGKHYFSVQDTSNGTNIYSLYRFLLTPTGSGTPVSGRYETQTQLFSKKVTIKQVRVYTDPTVTGNGFSLELLGSDKTVYTNGTFSYTYSAGTDVTKLQGALQRINFNPSMVDVYSLGLRITNSGSTNMVINKVEIDYEQSGK